MINAKEEFLEHIGNLKVKCAIINRDDHNIVSLLKLNYTEEEYTTFLESINFTYHNGYGGQELFGTIWFEDGTWSTRGEYDGSEWWEHYKLPEIPKELI